ncbi:MAG: preprotein translocase subunit SecG [Candidatus Krumholzibacteriia bacterium]
MFAFFVVVHSIISATLILVVLLQSGRGGGLAGAFGGGGAAQTFFGGRGAATFLSKLTSWLAVGFMIMSILLAVLSSRGGASGEGLLQQRARQQAGELALPSTSSLDPATALDSLGALPLEGAPAVSEPPSEEATSEGQPGAPDASEGEDRPTEPGGSPDEQNP